jgi:hypothetical protein
MKFISILPAFCILLATGCATSDQQKLALDHGPRATSTPWLNQQITEHQAAERKLAANAAQAQAPAADNSASH